MNDDTTAGEDAIIVYFDGYCNLCNAWVNFLLRADKHNRLAFAALTSSAAKAIVGGQTGGAAVPNSVIFEDNGTTYFKSTAVLRILKHLGGLWLIPFALIIIPRPIRDFFYDLIARNRYAWFGRRSQCRTPSPQERGRFRD